VQVQQIVIKSFAQGHVETADSAVSASAKSGRTGTPAAGAERLDRFATLRQMVNPPQASARETGAA
jgi:hypothetical protein